LRFRKPNYSQGQAVCLSTHDFLYQETDTQSSSIDKRKYSKAQRISFVSTNNIFSC